MNRPFNRSPLLRIAAGALTTLIAVTGFAATSGPATAAISPTPVAPQQRSAGTVSADALPTVQIDSGVVWDQAVVGTTVYAGGQFTQTRPAGAKTGEQLTPRSNLLAYDLTTGNLLPFTHQVNGTVRSVQASPDGTRLYIGGSFTQVDGKGRWGIAAFDLATGELLSSFHPAIGGTYVNAITVSETNIYVGGLFTQANRVKRTNLAAFDLDGDLTGWAPTTNTQVDAMVMAPSGNRLIVGGRFTTVNGASAPRSAALDPVSGATLPWQLNTILGGTGSGTGSGVMGLSTDGTNIYGVGWLQRSWYFEGVWAADPETGDLVWAADGHGDQYGVFAGEGGVYSVGHSHVSSPFGGWPDMKTPSGSYQFSMALTSDARGPLAPGGRSKQSAKDLTGSPAPALVQWYPNWISGKATGMGQAGWTIEGNDDYVVVGGEFVGVNGKLQQGLARFARSAVAPSAQGPRLSATPHNATDTWETPTFTAITGGAQVEIQPNFDRDDRTLRYELYRSGTTAPVASTTLDSDSWTRAAQTVTLKDMSATPNTSYTYTVTAIDSDGNTASSKTVTGKTGRFTPPTKAVATGQMTGMTGAFDATGSTAITGAQINSSMWDFGDGTSATGDTVSHSYEAPGTYTVALTVTDNRGGSATTTISVTADKDIARDTFERTAGTWGNAEVGGAWTTTKGPKVSDGAGQMSSAKGQTVAAWLKAVNAQNIDTTMGFSFDKTPAGGGSFISVAARRTDAGEYRSKIVAGANGTVSVYLTKIVNGTETTLKPAVLPNATAVAGQSFRVRFQAVSAADGATELRVRVWPSDQSEPADWFLRAADAEPGLQGPGYVGIVSYLSSASTISPQTVNIEDFTVTAP